MTVILMSRNNHEGHKLEDLLESVVGDLGEKNSMIEDDTSPCSRRVTANNNRIISLLNECISYQEDTLKQLEELGPNEGVEGKPRIGNK